MRDRDANLFRIWRCGREANMTVSQIEAVIIANDDDNPHDALRSLDASLDMDLLVIEAALNRRV